MTPLDEVRARLKKYPRVNDPEFCKAYLSAGRSTLKHLGLRAASLDDALRRGFEFLKNDHPGRDWNSVFHGSDVHEERSLALSWFYARSKKRENLLPDWRVLKSWAPEMDNWAHADALCGIYARLLEQAPKKILPVLRSWNRSKNPWLRRISIVSLLHYAGSRDSVLPAATLVPLIEAQLDHEDIFVQKGVGWALRELGNVYPVEHRRFLKKHLHRISGTAFSAATEKLSRAEKLPYLQTRRRHRSKG